MNWFGTKNKVTSKNASPSINKYLEAKKERKKPLKLPIKEAKFIVFDTETSGFNIKEDYLLSIGAICVQNNSILLNEALELVINAPETKGKEHVEIHQILPSVSMQGVEQKFALENFLELIESHIIVGHHVDYDISMVSHKLNKLFGIKLHNYFLDTGTLAIRLEHPPSSTEPVVGKDYTLDSLCERYNIPPTDRHNAAGDAFITAQLLIKLFKKAETRGLKTVGDLIKKPAGVLL